MTNKRLKQGDDIFHDSPDFCNTFDKHIFTCYGIITINIEFLQMTYTKARQQIQRNRSKVLGIGKDLEIKSLSPSLYRPFHLHFSVSVHLFCGTTHSLFSRTNFPYCCLIRLEQVDERKTVFCYAISQVLYYNGLGIQFLVHSQQ